MNKAPAFQFYVDDFLGGTFNLTDAELGLYIRLLCVQWSSGYIPDDDDEIASYGKGSTRIDRVKQKFKVCDDGKLRNKRMEDVRNQRNAWIEKSRIGGLHSAEARKGGSRVVGKWFEPNGNTPTPTPTPTTKTTKLRQSSNEKWPTHKAELVSTIEGLLGNEWENDRSKWLKRIKNEYHKTERVVSEVGLAIRERRIKTTPAAYSEQIWKEFQ